MNAVLITGAGRGIGRATALLCGARGWSVGVNFLNDAESAQRVTVHSQAAAWMWLVGILGGLTIVVVGYLGFR